MTRSIITSVNAGVATLTLSQPEIRNAFSDVVIAEITAAFAEVGQRDDVRAVVLAAVVAGREIGNAGRAVEVDREVEIAFAARRGARDLLNCLHALGQQAGLHKAMFIQIDVHAGVAQVAIGGNQLRQHYVFRCVKISQQIMILINKFQLYFYYLLIPPYHGLSLFFPR